MKKHILLIGFVLMAIVSQGQKPLKQTSCEIYESLEKLNFLGSVLYLAAHPDDENTRLIAYLSNDVKARTAYLSLTRGDGGQNLIGTELKELLGVLRTQELLMARSVDGGEQYFSRANDFGYSKHPDETLNIWNKKEVLSDVVRTIRKFRPDVIINRFDHESAGKTHGHHTSSALLSYEAFDLTGDKTYYPDQLDQLEPWSPRRLYFNTSWWFYGSEEKFNAADKTGMITVDIGSYYPCFGKSNTEIAAESRSMHKCQGFGSTGTRGSKQEYLKLLKGDVPLSNNNIFDGINTTWTRVKNGADVGILLEKIITNYDYSNPAASVKDLVQLRSLIEKTGDKSWKEIKLRDLDQIIQSCTGLFLEVAANESTANPGDMIDLDIEYINRSEANIQLEKIVFQPNIQDTILLTTLSFNEANLLTKTIKIPNDFDYTSHYWLREKGTLGMYNVTDPSKIGLPETPRDLKLDFYVNIEGKTICISKNIIYKFNDPAEGEIYQAFEIVPPISLQIEKSVYLFADNNSKKVTFNIQAQKANVSGTLNLNLPKQWTADKDKIGFSIDQKGETLSITTNITAPQTGMSIDLKPSIVLNGKTYNDELITVDYNHIPRQMVLMPSSTKLVKMDIQRKGNLIGYIMGAGDEIPEQLREIGYEVEIIELSNFPSDLSKYDAIISGIRAYNVLDDIKFFQDKLMQYVFNGGTYLSQYTTTRGKKVDEVGPYHISISRERVSDEYAKMNILEPEHQIFNYPNQITQDDFDDWVQERGLYFADEWDENYKALLSSHDKDEPDRKGGLLVAKYGKGYHVHTGYSWFRQLPAGVPGAFRIFANMISLSQKNTTSE